MNRKVLIALVVAVLGGAFAAYSMAKPKAVSKDRIQGTIYVLPKQFTLNLADGRYCTLTVALVLDPSQAIGAAAEGGATPPDGFGNLPEEAAVRDIVTNAVTNESSATMISPSGRTRVKRLVLAQIKARTDVKATSLLFTDVAVQ